jgi:hypothetical protein
LNSIQPDQIKILPYLRAVLRTLSAPNKEISCMIAILSSVALKKGYLPLRMLKNMIPVLQMSTAFNFQNDYH